MTAGFTTGEIVAAEAIIGGDIDDQRRGSLVNHVLPGRLILFPHLVDVVEQGPRGFRIFLD